MVSRQRLRFGGLALLTMLTLGSGAGCGTTPNREYNPNYNQPQTNTYPLEQEKNTSNNYSSKDSLLNMFTGFGCLFYLLAN